MSVPTYDAYMLPMLQMAADGEEHDIHEARVVIAEMMQLTEDQLSELLPSGRKTKYKDRINWAKTYLTKARLMERTGRGKFRITQRGLDMLSTQPEYLDRHVLNQFKEFQEFNTVPAPPNTPGRGRRTKRRSDTEQKTQAKQSPALERIKDAYKEHQVSVTQELKHFVSATRFDVFQKVLAELLDAMRYRVPEPLRISQTQKRTLYGTIHEDQLGLGTVFLWACQWTRSEHITQTEIEKYMRQMADAGHKKGILMTSSCVDADASATINAQTDYHVALIDGDGLVQLLIEHGIGVHTEQTYVIQQVDRNYFPST
jgi:restriction system protein